uniref:Ubiquitin carboxyl-terminal hydrolase n=1 Tax=Corethrella appendiculata TaxID=1370023 RepID=U5EYX0_9DIPT
MVKKKRSDPNSDGESSSTSSDEGIAPTKHLNKFENSCSHIMKAVELVAIRKKIKTTVIDRKCSKCNENMLPANTIVNDFDLDCENSLPSMWLCLKCGSHLCGRDRNKHALAHFTTPRSDSHALALNTVSWEVWCYECDEYVSATQKPKLQECVAVVKKEFSKFSNDSVIDVSKSNIEEKMISGIDSLRSITSLFDNNDKSSSSSATTTNASAMIANMDMGKKIISHYDNIPRVRGLSNLGNTCFFNAVLQCLARTPYILDILKESAEKGEKFELPGGELKLSDDTVTLLPPIIGILNAWGNLTETLFETLTELQTGVGVFTPRKLLTQLTNKWPQFQGGDQHDSHELLRHLLESVRSEDLRRYQMVILKTLGFTSKVDPQTVEDVIRQKIKLYGQQASDRILRPEPVFRGFLVSTLTCQDCFHTSSRHESFLDLSLPVCTEKPQPPIRRKGSPEPNCYSASNANTDVLTKSQIKKEKEREKKARRQAKKQHSKISLSSSTVSNNDSGVSVGNTTTNSINDNSNRTTSTSSSSSDADVEDNLTDDTQKSKIATKGASIVCDANGNVFNDCKSPEKTDDTPENPNKPDYERPISRCDFVSEKPTVAKTAPNIVVELGISREGVANLVKNRQNSIENSSSNLNNIENLVVKLHIDEDEDEDEDDDDVIVDGDMAGAAAMAAKKSAKQKRQRTFSHTDWSTTLAPRYQCEDGECSIQSCLSNFTTIELMTGNNKVGCEACTEKINGKDGKTVYTNATKQFLISSPPAVLILHLKRFQVGPRCMFRKITKHVTFPFLLDLAPFCGSKAKKLPNIRLHQKKLLYSLYGIVEHSGGMHGGHYVAFVKVRLPTTKTENSWDYLPKGSKAELDQIDEQRERLEKALAKEKAREMGIKLNDSDDTITSSSSGDDENNAGKQQEGAVGGSPDNIDPNTITNPPGKWYYVSDSMVKETSEEIVLKAQAYLLFYERIF